MGLLLPRLGLVLLLAVAVSACGQRGALYLPGTPDPAEQPATPAEDEERDEEAGS
ncbi:MAG: lipoprotein [Pseudomonadota bacterium]